MATDLILPSLGFDMTEGKLLRWLCSEGDRVEKGQPIAEIETEKATVEIEASVSGILARIVVQAGQTVPVGTVIGIIAQPGEQVAGPQERPAPAGAPSPEAPAPPQQAAGGDTAAPSPQAPAPPRASAGEIAAPPPGRVKASPVARKMAQDAGIDIGAILGSGPDGRVMERDVEAAIASRRTPAAEGAPAPAPPQPSGAPPAAGPAAMTPMRQAIARRMAQSKATAPHFYITVEIDMDEAMRLREQLNAVATDEEKLSVNDLVVAAAARTLTRFRMLNASYREGGIELHPRINIGIAVALDDGLITPVLRDADSKSLRAIAVETKALSERARANKLRADDLGPGTFTVSNLGMFDVDQFVAIINPPEAAILAVGSVTPRPAAAGGAVRVAATLKATLSVDHRVADGAQAARFTQALKKLLENPVNLLAP